MRAFILHAYAIEIVVAEDAAKVIPYLIEFSGFKHHMFLIAFFVQLFPVLNLIPVKIDVFNHFNHKEIDN
jgi:hypothetical protein